MASAFFKIDIIESKPLFTFDYVIYTLKNQLLVRNLEELNCKRVGVTLAFNPSAFGLDQNKIKFDTISKIDFSIRKLKDGRVDMIIRRYPDEKDLHYYKNLVLYSSYDRLICHPT